jgi:two-component system, OmpR family, sensor histidine kinase MtrB
MDSNAIAQWAHDIRNTLGTVALYREALERHADTVGILARSDALLKKAMTMCTDLMREAGQSGMKMPQQTFDVTRTIEEVVELVAPVVPAATTLRLVSSGPVYVTANPKDMFRILFNLIHNAVGVARTAGTLRRIALALEQNDATVTIRVADDGPGLPDDVRKRLFQRDPSAPSGRGYGLSIARELAERNGAALELSNRARGTEFTIELQGVDPDDRQVSNARRPQRVVVD